MAAVHSGGHGPGFKDLIGQTFDRLTVLRFAGNRIKSGGKKGNALWDCVCVCGTERRLAGCDLTGGHTRSCGCLHHELQADRMRKASYRHGAAVGGRTTAEYRSHQNMLRRCYDATHQDYLN
jgi:hypothetical protein